MTWGKIDHDFLSNPKIAKAGEEAALFFLGAILYAGKHLTDGRVPKEILPKLAYPRKALLLARKLVDVGLLEREGEDFIIHDFHDWNPTASQVETKRNAERFRKTSGRKADGREPESEGQTQTPAPDSGSSTDSYQLGDPQAVEKSKNGVTLQTRLASVVELRGSAISSEAQQVISLLKPYFDDRVMDEMIGTMAGLEKRPRYPRYMLGMAPKWGADRGIEVPDLRARLKA